MKKDPSRKEKHILEAVTTLKEKCELKLVHSQVNGTKILEGEHVPNKNSCKISLEKERKELRS